MSTEAWRHDLLGELESMGRELSRCADALERLAAAGVTNRRAAWHTTIDEAQLREATERGNEW